MADKKISELTELTIPADGDLIPIVDNSVNPPTTKYISYVNLIARDQISFIYSTLGNQQGTSNNNGTFTKLSFGNDYAQLTDNLIDRPTPTRFRSKAAGWYRMVYHLYGVSSDNDRLAETIVTKNGLPAPLPGGTMRTGRTKNDDLTGATAGQELAILLALDDYLEIEAAPLNNTVINFEPFSSAAFELIRRI